MEKHKDINSGKKLREAGMMITTGFQGVGKTYQNMHLIKNYVSDKISIGVKGRKCLIFDTNGEYTAQQFADNDVPNFSPKLIALKDIPQWSASNIVECRRIDAKNVNPDKKIEILEYLLKRNVFQNGMLVIEDINTYILTVSHMKDIVGGLVGLRHKAVDLLISYQSLRAVEPRMWANAKYIRMHYQADNVDDIKGKVTSPDLMKIAQIMISTRYQRGDKRFFVYVENNIGVEGNFDKAEFLGACRHFLNIRKKHIKEYMSQFNVKREQAIEAVCEQLYQLYYQNPDKVVKVDAE